MTLYLEDFGAWLHDLGTKPLPGGVSAAAVTSAMGAALVAKAVRVSLHRQKMKQEDRAACEAVWNLARDRQQVLLGLAETDEHAYRALLASRAHRDEPRVGDDAWQEATEVPICLAEACHLLSKQLPDVLALCWPPVQPDLRVGCWLLETGIRAGLLAAENNLSAWGNTPQAESLRLRIDTLKRLTSTLHPRAPGAVPTVGNGRPTITLPLDRSGRC